MPCPALSQGEAGIPRAPGRPPQGGAVAAVASMFPMRSMMSQHFQSIALREHEVEHDAIEGLVVHEEEAFLA